MKIVYLVPGADDPSYLKVVQQRLEEVAGNSVTVLTESVSHGIALEHGYYVAMLLEDLLHRVYAHHRIADAIVIGCALDVGLQEARELVEVPVVGIAEATLKTATMLGHKFSVLAGIDSLVPKVERLIKSYGLQDSLASIRATSLTVSQMRSPDKNGREHVKKVIWAAVQEDGAEVIVAACGSLGEYFATLHDDVPVPLLDPRVIGFKASVYLADLYRRGLAKTSKVGLYETPSVLPSKVT